MTKWGRRGFLWHMSNFSKIIIDSLSLSKPVPNKTWRRKTNYFKWRSLKPSMAINKTSKSYSQQNRLQTPKLHAVRLRKKWTLKRRLLVTLLILVAITLPTFIFMEQNLREPLMHVAKIRIKQLATQAINQAITEQVTENSKTESLIDWKMDSNGKVSGFMLNYAEHMKITSDTINTVQSTLNDLQHVPERIPVGHALNSAIISNYGPKIPVNFEPLGAVKVELNTREKNAAINMVLVEVYIKVITEIAIIIPFDTEPEVVEAEIPVSYLLVVGDVPMYYYDSKGNPVGESAPQAPNISVPLQDSEGITSNDSNISSKDTPHVEEDKVDNN